MSLSPLQPKFNLAQTVTGGVKKTDDLKKQDKKQDVAKQDAKKAETKQVEVKKEEVQKQELVKQEPPKPTDLGKAQQVANRLNATLKAAVPLQTTRGGQVFEAGSDAIEKYKDQVKLSAQEKADVKTAGQLSTIGFNQGVKTYIAEKAASYIFGDQAKKFQSSQSERNVALKIIKKVLDKGSFSGADFKGDEEFRKVMNDPDKASKVLLIVQDSVDHYMEETSQLLEDPRTQAQKLAEETLKIAKVVIEAEQNIRAEDQRNTTKELVWGVGTQLDMFA